MSVNHVAAEALARGLAELDPAGRDALDLCVPNALAVAYLDLRRLAQICLDRMDEHDCMDCGIASDLGEAIGALHDASKASE